MTAILKARFEKRFSTETVISSEWQTPIDEFSITVLFGPSGCGKTTILRCLAGLERPEKGTIQFGSELWFDADRGLCLTPQQRDVGFLFQDYALFPHLTVSRNIAYGLRGLSHAEQRQRVGEVLDLFQLTGLEERSPLRVSGGQQQRIALARVLARRPQLLLLDEPLSALDTPTREELRIELRRLLASFRIPVFIVTHDRIEAMALADHLIVMDRGKVCQQGSVSDVFSRPSNLDVARIVGMETVQTGQVMRIEDGLATVAVGRAQLIALAPPRGDREVQVCIRAEEVILQKRAPDQTSPRNRLEGIIRSLVIEGPMVRVFLDCGFPLVALVTRPACEELGLVEGGSVLALIKVPAIHLIGRG